MVARPHQTQDEPGRERAVALLQRVERIASQAQLLPIGHEENRAVAEHAEQRECRRREVGTRHTECPVVDDAEAWKDEQDRQEPHTWPDLADIVRPSQKYGRAGPTPLVVREE